MCAIDFGISHGGGNDITSHLRAKDDTTICERLCNQLLKSLLPSNLKQVIKELNQRSGGLHLLLRTTNPSFSDHATKLFIKMFHRLLVLINAHCFAQMLWKCLQMATKKKHVMLTISEKLKIIDLRAVADLGFEKGGFP